MQLSTVTIINPGISLPQSDMTILIRGGEIVSVAKSQSVSVPRSAKVLDAIRNMGGPAKEVFPLRDAVAAGRRLGPKIVACGPIVDALNSWSNPNFTVSVATPEEARSTVIALKKQGADFIKVYDGLSPAAYHAIADETTKLGFPFAGHRPVAISVRQASNAGQLSIEHGVALSGGSTTEDDFIKQASDSSVFQEALRTRTAPRCSIISVRPAPTKPTASRPPTKLS